MDHACVVYVKGLVFMFVNNTYFIDSISVDIVSYINFVICVHVYNRCCVRICFGVHTSAQPTPKCYSVFSIFVMLILLTITKQKLGSLGEK